MNERISIIKCNVLCVSCVMCDVLCVMCYVACVVKCITCDVGLLTPYIHTKNSYQNTSNRPELFIIIPKDNMFQLYDILIVYHPGGGQTCVVHGIQIKSNIMKKRKPSGNIPHPHTLVDKSILIRGSKAEPRV